MSRERNTESKRTKSPSKSFLKSASAQVMVPRLLVILSTAFLLAVGLVMVYSSSSITSLVEQGDPLGETVKQCIFALLGIGIAVFISLKLKEGHWRGLFGTGFYFVCLGGLFLTALLGTVGLGAKRWLIIGPISLQISEFAKIALVIIAAKYVEQYWEGRIGGFDLLKPIAAVIVPLFFIVVLQSDLGTTIICFAGLIAVVVCSGVSGRTIAISLGMVALAAVAITLVTPYRAARLSNFTDPWADAQGTGYQLVHSFQALASGGFFGVGIGNSYEKLQYLPEAETDFIFAIIGEELGFIGGALVILAFLAFLWGGFRIAQQARSPFSAYIAAGLTVMIVFQAFLNIACVMGFAPTTGKPLPFISSGGSSLLSSLTLVGILLSISFDSNSEGEYRQRRDNLRVVSSAAGQPLAEGSSAGYGLSPHLGGSGVPGGNVGRGRSGSDRRHSSGGRAGIEGRTGTGGRSRSEGRSGSGARSGSGGRSGSGSANGRRDSGGSGARRHPDGSRNQRSGQQHGGRIRLSQAQQQEYSPALHFTGAGAASAYATQARSMRAQRR
jgi:cell division protein FtsW